MPKSLIYITIILFSLSACSKKGEVDLGIKKEVIDAKDCKITSNTRSDGQQYHFVFKDGQIQNILGFNDFDTFIYSGGKITKGVNSKNANAYILFDFDSKTLLKKVTFEGKDSQGKFFSYASNITYNSINKIDKLTLNWPTFPDKVETKFTYDIKGNVKYISALIDGEWQTLLENTSFDESPSPYKNQQLGNILSYYMVYSLLSGGYNFTHYINANNVKTAVVKKGIEKITYSYDYKYNSQGFPSEVNYTRSQNNRPTPLSEKFSYDCEL